MESIIRTVKDIQADHRNWLEETLGHRLKDEQQIVIRVLGPDSVPDPAVQAQALADLRRLSEEGTHHRESLGISETAAEEALDEAMDRTRPRED